MVNSVKMEYLGVILLVITITIAGSISEGGSEPSEPHPNNPTTTSSICSERSPLFKNASEKLKTYILDIFKNASDGKIQNITETLNSTSYEYLEAAKTCNVNATALLKSWRSDVIIGLINFAVKNVTKLQELKQKGQDKCILKHEQEIQNCIETITDPKTNKSSLMKLYKPDFTDLTCARSNTTKVCVLNILNNYCNESVSFATSLFDYVYHQYCKKDTPKSSSARISAFWVGFVVFIVEFTKRATI